MADDDSFTEVTSTSWFSRIGKSFRGIGAGLVLIALSTALMYWNEGRTVRTGDAIAEAQQVTVVLPSLNAVDAAFEGKTVYAKGRAVTKDELTDPIFGVKTTGAIQLRRKVEYYQWVESTSTEKRKKLGGEEETVTTYSYARKWVSQPVDSTSFKRVDGHENVTRIQSETAEWMAPNVTFGAYRLPDFLVSSISGERALNTKLTEVQCVELQQALFPSAYEGEGNDAIEQHAATVRGSSSMMHPQGNTLYVGRQPNAPKVGDVRVSFFEVPAADIAIIAKVSGDTFMTFRASNGTSFSKLSMGAPDMAVMFEDAQSENTILAWVLRVVGIVLCIGGFNALVAPLQVLADVVPLLGSIVGAGTGFVAFLVGLAWSFVVIAIAWIRFRPVLACCLLGAALIFIVLLFVKGRMRKAPAVQA